MRPNCMISEQRLNQIETEAAEAGDQRTVLLCDRVRGASVKVIAARRKANVSQAQAEREIRALLSPEECRGHWTCVMALYVAFPK